MDERDVSIMDLQKSLDDMRIERNKWRDIATELSTDLAIEYCSTPNKILDNTWDFIQRCGLTNFNEVVRGD